MAYAAESKFVVLVFPPFVLYHFELHCLTVVQPSVIAAINNLPVVVDANQVVVCDKREVQTFHSISAMGIFYV